MKTLGIDPGTKNFSFFLLDENGENKEVCVPTEKIKNDPDYAIKTVKKFNPDAVSAPSGYGLPLKKVEDLSEDDFFSISLKKDEISSIGVRKILGLMIKNKINAYVLPSVKHLPTVEVHRKINKIDLGTPDKVSSAVYALSTFKDYKEASFVLAELGSAFNAFIKVKKGRIIDGIGGSNASSGFISGGKIDSEILYLENEKIKKIGKFSGGVESIIGKSTKPEDFFEKPGEYQKGFIAYNYFIEGILKDISSLSPDRVVVSGKNSKYAYREIQKKYKTETIEEGKASPASKGAAMIVNGVCGGKFRGLIEWTEIKKACGDVLDYMYV